HTIVVWSAAHVVQHPAPVLLMATAPAAIDPLSLHDALPIYRPPPRTRRRGGPADPAAPPRLRQRRDRPGRRRIQHRPAHGSGRCRAPSRDPLRRQPGVLGPRLPRPVAAPAPAPPDRPD